VVKEVNLLPLRRKSREITVGGVKIGGKNPIVVQSMTSTKTRDVEETLRQIEALASAGCELVRVAVPKNEDLKALREIVKRSPVPIIADVHYRADLALGALEAGTAGLRINPGNLGDEVKVREIVEEAKRRNAAIRIGVNGGSLERDLLEKYGAPTAEALARSALRWSEKFEDWGFLNFKVSIKGSDVLTCVEANKIFAQKSEAPLHVGITEAGFGESGIVKSSVGIGILLYLGIGDTLRVSLTGDPVEEVKVAYQILASLGLRARGVQIVSCPTCGRIEVDLPKVVGEVQRRLSKVKKPIKVAVMGCVVNGPGEAREADVGLACGKGRALLFKNGKIVKTLKEEEMIEALVREVERIERGEN